ncbi:hypothetical protein [Turicimonas muris]|uniref:hypothetical protein n=1 Tax=Turicimonas muris TaxID=1796652 RepID=UPI003F667AC9
MIWFFAFNDQARVGSARRPTVVKKKPPSLLLKAVMATCAVECRQASPASERLLGGRLPRLHFWAVQIVESRTDGFFGHGLKQSLSVGFLVFTASICNGK